MKLGIIAAMKIEAEKIIAAMKNTCTEECGGITFTVGMLGNCEAVCAVCGIGKVFAAMCTEAMIIKYHPDSIINTGVAGTLTKSLTIGDIAVSDAVVQHDMDTSPLGDPVGLISGINMVRIPSSAELVSAILFAASEMDIKCVCGTVASGDKFIADLKTKKYIADTFAAVACEMEGAAVGQVCYVNGVPFAVIRSISDDADGRACDYYPSFAERAAEKSAAIAIKLAENLK